MIELRDRSDVIQARLAARDLVRAAGLGVMDQSRFATAVSELGSHALGRQVQASCELADLSDTGVHRLQARFSESHAGLPDGATPEAPGVRQLVDVFNAARTAQTSEVIVQIVRRRRVAPASAT